MHTASITQLPNPAMHTIRFSGGTLYIYESIVVGTFLMSTSSSLILFPEVQLNVSVSFSWTSSGIVTCSSGYPGGFINLLPSSKSTFSGQVSIALVTFVNFGLLTYSSSSISSSSITLINSASFINRPSMQYIRD